MKLSSKDALKRFPLEFKTIYCKVFRNGQKIIITIDFFKIAVF